MSVRIAEDGHCACGKRLAVFVRHKTLFCWSCESEYDATTLEQVQNFAWRKTERGFEHIKQTRIDDGPLR